MAHPDDEILGCGALLSRLRNSTIVHVTDGAPKRGADVVRAGFQTPGDYAAARRREAEAALAFAGVDASRLIGLGIDDQEVSLHLPAVARRLEQLIVDADVVLTHAFEGGHSDHDAVAFAVSMARNVAAPSAELVEMPFYYGDDKGWVRQHFLPHPAAASPWVEELDEPARELKRRMIEAHASQRETLASFSLEREQFRPAPAYDFRRRPHAGPLLYERHGWNLTWTDWVARIDAARIQLGAAA